MASSNFVKRAQVVQPTPYLIEVDDGGAALTTFLAGLAAASLTANENESAKHDQNSLLWAVALKDNIAGADTSDAGTAWVVSAEVYKRIKAHRYTNAP